jgi:hypothetical protein
MSKNPTPKKRGKIDDVAIAAAEIQYAKAAALLAGIPVALWNGTWDDATIDAALELLRAAKKYRDVAHTMYGTRGRFIEK